MQSIASIGLANQLEVPVGATSGGPTGPRSRSPGPFVGSCYIVVSNVQRNIDRIAAGPLGEVVLVWRSCAVRLVAAPGLLTGFAASCGSDEPRKEPRLDEEMVLIFGNGLECDNRREVVASFDGEDTWHLTAQCLDDRSDGVYFLGERRSASPSQYHRPRPVFTGTARLPSEAPRCDELPSGTCIGE